MMRAFARWPDEVLLDLVHQELASCGAAEPQLMTLLQHFARRSGQPFVSAQGSEWSQEISATPQAHSLIHTLRDRVRQAARQQVKTRGVVDLGTLPLSLQGADRLTLPHPGWGIAFGVKGRSSGLVLGIGQGHYDRGARVISGVLQLRLVDVFGVSDVDNDTHGQIALWVLQHQRGYPPFLHEIVLEAPLRVSLATASTRGPVPNRRLAA
jgi:hypothetical protein